MQSLLEDRFQLRAHLTRGPVYVLESADDAPVSGQKPVEKGIGVIERKRRTVTFRGASSASIAETLSTLLSSHVLDHTKPGVTYDFQIEVPRTDLKRLGDELHDRAGLILKSFTVDQLVIDGAQRPRLDATPAPRSRSPHAERGTPKRRHGPAHAAASMAIPTPWNPPTLVVCRSDLHFAAPGGGCGHRAPPPAGAAEAVKTLRYE